MKRNKKQQKPTEQQAKSQQERAPRTDAGERRRSCNVKEPEIKKGMYRAAFTKQKTKRHLYKPMGHSQQHGDAGRHAL